MLYATGKIKELTHELGRYEWDILGLAEVRWMGFGKTQTKDTKSVYASTSDFDDEHTETFYEEIGSTIQRTNRKDFLIIQGDWNAKVGPDAFDQWAGTVGRFGLGKTNDRGYRLLEFACSQKLTIANTPHTHKPSRRATWHSPNGKVHNQIDFILIPRRFKSSIYMAQTRTFPGAAVGSDHDMVLLTLKLKLRRQQEQKIPQIRYDIGKLQDPAVAASFEAQISGKFAALNLLQNDINTLTEEFKEVLHETAAKVLGKPRKKEKPWLTPR
ncbi:craniofacial development protein 2-like [Lineus longissimus]|uniref:craniofacial development protein 2-like n=1 Tax=Lineus longissimus TaxID=88925 RepID=UPI00315D3A46